MNNAKQDLKLTSTFKNFSIGDNVSFTFNGAICRGIVVERLYDNNTDKIFKVHISESNNWELVGSNDEPNLPMSELTLVPPQSYF